MQIVKSHYNSCQYGNQTPLMVMTVDCSYKVKS